MTETDASVRLLGELYQGAAMGEQGTELLIGKTDDPQFSEKLHEYASQYNAIKSEAASLLSQRGEVPQDTSAMEKANLWMGVQMNTLLDQSPAHMAEMLIQGGTMGIIDGVKEKKQHPDADRKSRRLEERFLSLQQDYIDDMKEFLQ